MTQQEIQDYINSILSKIFNPNLKMEVIVEKETENYSRIICFIGGKRINSCEIGATDSMRYVQETLETFLIEDIIPDILYK